MSNASAPHKIKNIVIIGGGIIGCTTAYYLSRHPSFSSATTVKVIEASLHGVAQGASGKAGGLVAKWAYPSELVKVSFPEHVKLANEHNGKERWGFRYTQCGSWEGTGRVSREQSGKRVEKSLEKTLGLEDGVRSTAGESKSRRKKGLPEDLLWVEEHLTEGYSPMAPDGHTAQVHPYLFTTSMMELAKEKGVELVQGRVTSIIRDDGKVTGVEYEKPGSTEKETVSATDVILTAGAWSPSLVPSLPIDGSRAHSIIIHLDSSVMISAYALFTSIELPTGDSVTPEIYARPGNELYACSGADDCPLPDTVDGVQVDLETCEALQRNVGSISQEIRSGKVDKKQACFLPVVRYGGGPIIGPAPKIAQGLFIAAGHTCWGICNAPGTGKILTELVMEGKVSSANIKGLQPSRFL